MKNKTGAMEMTVGTIVTIVLLMSALVLGLILTKTIFTNTTDNVNTINDQVKGEIQNLFGSEGKKLIVGLGGQSTATVRQGTDNFGIPFGFAPDNPNAWGLNRDGCKYDIQVSPSSSKDACTNNGWTNPLADIFPGTSNIKFDEVDSNVGYALIKVNVPASMPPCKQRFNVLVKCVGAQYSSETTTGAFEIDVIKKGIF